jgi:hypothetical protein
VGFGSPWITTGCTPRAPPGPRATVPDCPQSLACPDAPRQAPAGRASAPAGACCPSLASLDCLQPSLDIAGISLSQTSPPRQAGLRSPPPHRTPVATAPPRAPFASPPGVSCCERSEGFCHQARAPTVLHLCTVIPLATRCMCMAHRAASVRQFRLPKHAFSASTWQGPRQVHWHWQVRCSRAFLGSWLPA